MEYTSLEIQSLRKARKNDRFMAIAFGFFFVLAGFASLICFSNQMKILGTVTIVLQVIAFAISMSKLSDSKIPLPV